MKLKFAIYDLRLAIWKKSADSAASNRQSSIVHHQSQRGVALIITLILLSVALVMALAFLAISGHERNSVTTQTDLATTRLAAEAGLASAEAQIAANVLSTTNPYTFDLLVSTNYLPLSTGNPLADLTNLLYSPRAPVWVTNTVAHVMENRFYLDLNRNGRDDPNGVMPATNNAGQEILNGGDPIFVDNVGDPEWIGVLAHPGQPYGLNNPFIARFAFIALPVGNSLDWNAIHNQALSQARRPLTLGSIARDFYFRNQGVGSWEINLAAFLADLNNNQWDTTGAPYNYAQPAFQNTGNAFDDAFAMLTNRYAGAYQTMPSVTTLFGAAGATAFANDNIDGYSDGPLMTGTQLPVDRNNTTYFWLGADNTNHFFTPEELFDPAKSSGGFTNRLLSTGNGVSTYDRYTFYRMLSQIGTDTSPESGKMNLNYDNLDPAFNGVASETNFMAWTPLVFFTNAADRMLKAYTTQWFQSGPSNFLATYYGISGYNYYHQDSFGNTITNDPGGLGLTNVPFFGMTNQIPAFGVTDIPVWVGYSNQFVYTPAVQRVLQLAANIYDASTRNYYPDIFRPVFTASTNFAGGYINVFVTGYTNVVPMVNPASDTQLNLPVDASAVRGVNTFTNVYGVPWIIGAKKGFPNFNAFTLENVFQLTRKLQLTRPNTSVNYLSNPDQYTFSQQLTLNIANLFNVECWNSYRADYTNAQPMQIFATVTNTAVLTNDLGLNYVIGSYYQNGVTNSDWPGYGYNSIPQPNSFLYPLFSTNAVVLPDSIYTFNNANPLVPPQPAYFVPNTLMPHWGLLMTNRLRVVMVEHNTADNLWHVIDYAQLAGPDSSHDLTADIQALYDTKVNSAYDDQWDTNRDAKGLPIGFANQVGVSAQLVSLRLSPYWSQQDPTWVTNQTAAFRAFLGFGPLPGMPPSVSQYIAIGQASTNMQAPYGPTALVAYQTQWSANDPLVHYIASDLTDLNKSSAALNYLNPLTFGVLEDRYMPWGGSPQYSGKDLNPYNLTLKDPLVASSDAWNFPTNRFPTAGWLGRVHRGTPWQTAYLKSADVLANNNVRTWMLLTGNANPFDATNTAPVQDRRLFDLFTTAVNDNATRGTLSVNQSADQYDSVANPDAGLAAWSAVFSGIVVPTNSAGGYTVINPAGTAGSSSLLGGLVADINSVRATFTNTDGLVGAFEHAGDILATPGLTVSNQWLLLNNGDPINGISDAMYEWLPQQVMSLVRVGTPRYIIYSWGQALKPAPTPNGIFTGGGLLITNYQVVAESATRAVVRFDTMRTNDVNGAITVTPPHAVIESFNLLPPD